MENTRPPDPRSGGRFRFDRMLLFGATLAAMKAPLALLIACTSLLFAAGDPAPATPRVGFAWPLPTCPVSGEPLGAKPVVRVLEDAKDPAVNGREVRFCCEKCVATFEADRAGSLRKADEAIVKMEWPWYPLVTCPVMPDETIVSPGQAPPKGLRETVVGNQLIVLCCAQCERKVRRNPAAWIEKIRAAMPKAHVPLYTLKTCPVSGKALPAEPCDIVLGGRLVRLCCDKCKAEAERDPQATLAKLGPAPAAKPAETSR